MMVPFEWQQVRARRNLQPFHGAAVVSESVEVRSKLRRRDDVVMSKSEDLEGVMRQTGTERLTNAAPDLSSNAMRT